MRYSLRARIPYSWFEVRATLQSGLPRLRTSGHKSAVLSLGFDALGTRLVSGGKDTDVIVWDIVNECGLYSSKDTYIKLWDLDTCHCFQTLVDHRSEVWAGELLRNETRLVTASSDIELRIYDILPPQDNDKSKWTRSEDDIKSGSGPISCLLLGNLKRQSSNRVLCLKCDSSADNLVVMLLLSLHTNMLELHTINLTLSTSTITHSISLPGHRSDIRTVSISSDGDLIASGSSDMIKLWNCSNFQCIHTLLSNHYVVSSTFVPGNRHLLVGTKSGEVLLYEVTSGSLLETFQAHTGSVWAVGVAPDRQGFATGSADHDVKFWEFELTTNDNYFLIRKRLTAAHVKTLKMSEDVLGLKYSPNQKVLALSLLDSTVKIFFADTLKFFLSLYGHKLPVLSMDISRYTLLVNGSADKNIRIWGLDFGDCHRSIFAHDDSIMAVQFVPDTHLFFTASKDRTLKCWDADNFEHVQTLEEREAEFEKAVAEGGEPVPEKYVLTVVKGIRSSDLEEALLVIPFSYMIDLLR
ncbi:LOW QUALITY PROTEIN: WD repeat-containing protein 3 homolog, partial [Gigantopelta aegis]|uniref:LOW QUALITY PROTEIN: WD repeat-containing protein 3 homolog n=1 Tax=Gigantopelta aegis TaxID=1735272 RepID=UPI001B88977B